MNHLGRRCCVSSAGGDGVMVMGEMRDGLWPFRSGVHTYKVKGKSAG